MKKISIILMLICFSTNVVAEVIIMKCKFYRYKFESSESGTTIYSANIKRDKKNFHKFCPAKVNDSNKHFLKSIEGVELIVSDYVATCKTAKSVLKSGVGTDSVSITDFKKLRRSSKYKWNGQPQTQKEKCKLEKI